LILFVCSFETFKRFPLAPFLGAKFAAVPADVGYRRW
jgi:hypothetical protein